MCGKGVATSGKQVTCEAKIEEHAFENHIDLPETR